MNAREHARLERRVIAAEELVRTRRAGALDAIEARRLVFRDVLDEGLSVAEIVALTGLNAMAVRKAVWPPTGKRSR